MGYMENYKKWCEDTYFDEATRAELKAIEGNDKEIQERFYKDLEFGTGGLRGIIGAGTNRLNIYTVSLLRVLPTISLSRAKRLLRKVLLLPLTVEE